MSSIFDGMASILNDTFGGGVVYLPKVGGEPVTVQATLRAGPVEVAGGDGAPVLILGPSLQVPKTILPNIGRGDRVFSVAAPDDVYLVANRIPNGSPADDAMIICELEEVQD